MASYEVTVKKTVTVEYFAEITVNAPNEEAAEAAAEKVAEVESESDSATIEWQFIVEDVVFEVESIEEL